jgi:hypothetical protein
LIATITTKMIIWTSGLALGLGAIALATLLEPPPGWHAPIEAAAGAALSARAPASEGGTEITSKSLGQSHSHLASDLKVSELQAACSASLATLPPGVRQLRLNGEGCLAKNALVETQITNATNGFSATIFATSSTTFTTDYISLAEGSNRLKIRHTYQDGRHDERELQIERGPASIR